MAQILNSLVVSEDIALQRALEDVIYNDIEMYHLTFTSYALSQLAEADREPDIIFIEKTPTLSSEDVVHVMQAFPQKTYIVVDETPIEDERRRFLRAGIDEVMSLSQLKSEVGKHLLEKILALKNLAEAEHRIEQSEERFRGIIEHAHDIITLLDEDGTIIYNSPAFSRQLGYASWEVLGQTIFTFIHEDDQETIHRRFKKLTAGADGSALEFRFRNQAGEWRFFEAMATNLLQNDLVKAVVLNSRDVTEQTEAEIELEKYRSHLEDLVERRTRELTAALETEKQAVEQQKTFISMVSHEFRTPLTIIDGNAQIIQKRGGTLTPEVLESRAGTIRSAVGRLVGLIETILSAHMLESGMLTITPAPCDVSAVIRAVCDDHLGVAPHHRITMDLSDMPQYMNVDEKMIRQIMVNLISNAVKYSPPHSGQDQLVEVRGFKTATDVVIEVRDHGVGIPENEIPRIFTRYFRASTSGGIAGSGLGLSLVKQFIELHHGKVEISSLVGAGTTLRIKIPLAAVIN